MLFIESHKRKYPTLSTIFDTNDKNTAKRNINPLIYTQQTWLPHISDLECKHGQLFWLGPMWTTLSNRCMVYGHMFIPFHISVFFVCFLSSLLLCWLLILCSIFPFPLRMWHLYFRFRSFCAGFDLSSHSLGWCNCTKVYHHKLHQWGKRWN